MTKIDERVNIQNYEPQSNNQLHVISIVKVTNAFRSGIFWTMITSVLRNIIIIFNNEVGNTVNTPTPNMKTVNNTHNTPSPLGYKETYISFNAVNLNWLGELHFIYSQKSKNQGMVLFSRTLFILKHSLT